MILMRTIYLVVLLQYARFHTPHSTVISKVSSKFSYLFRYLISSFIKSCSILSSTFFTISIFTSPTIVATPPSTMIFGSSSSISLCSILASHNCTFCCPFFLLFHSFPLTGLVIVMDIFLLSSNTFKINELENIWYIKLLEKVTSLIWFILFLVTKGVKFQSINNHKRNIHKYTVGATPWIFLYRRHLFYGLHI